MKVALSHNQLGASGGKAVPYNATIQHDIWTMWTLTLLFRVKWSSGRATVQSASWWKPSLHLGLRPSIEGCCPCASRSTHFVAKSTSPPLTWPLTFPLRITCHKVANIWTSHSGYCWGRSAAHPPLYGAHSAPQATPVWMRLCVCVRESLCARTLRL